MSVDIVEILKEPRMTRICAPMVRYSKLPFRTLVRRYNCDVCFTPMILADSFVQSSQARDNEFTTNSEDKPLVVQFAANNAEDFADASEMVAPYCNGVDLNCGCPQRWAMKEGYGCDLLTKPQLIKELVTRARNTIPKPFSVSVKIRLLKDIRRTIELCRTLEKAGISFLTVHARTPDMRKEPIDLEGLKTVRDCVTIPMIANGDVKNLKDAEELYQSSECDGVMSASGILSNPALFAGHPVTPLSCVQDWLNITQKIPATFISTHHHLIFMLEKVLTKSEKLVFNTLQSIEAILEYLDTNYGIRPSEEAAEEIPEPIVCDYERWTKKRTRKISRNEECETLDSSLGNLFI